MAPDFADDGVEDDGTGNVGSLGDRRVDGVVFSRMLPAMTPPDTRCGPVGLGGVDRLDARPPDPCLRTRRRQRRRVRRRAYRP